MIRSRESRFSPHLAVTAILAIVLLCAWAVVGTAPRAAATNCTPEDPNPPSGCPPATTTVTTQGVTSPNAGPDEVTYTIKDETGALVGSGSFLVVADGNHGTQSTSLVVSRSIGEAGAATDTSEAVTVNSSSTLAAGEHCRYVSTIRRHDFLRLGIRITAYKMQQDFYWCYDGRHVTRVRGHHTWFPYIQANWSYDGMVTWWLHAAAYGSNTRAAYKYGFEGHLTLHFLSFSANSYPWIETRGWYNGTYGISTNLAA